MLFIVWILYQLELSAAVGSPTSITADKLFPDFVGIRPKIYGPEEEPADFIIQTYTEHGVQGLVNLFGIESPGLTSSLALAKQVGKILN